MYRPRYAEASVLRVVIRQHVDEFLRVAADRADGARPPEFIAREFREFLICGVLAYGFARVRCGRCALELPDARDDPEPASAVSPPRDNQPALPFAVSS